MATNRFTKTREGLVAKPLSFDDYTKAGVVRAESIGRLSEFAATDLTFDVLGADQQFISEESGAIEESIDSITKSISEGNVDSSVVDTAVAARRKYNDVFGKNGTATLANSNLQVQRQWEAKINELAVQGNWPESKKQEILRRGNERFKGSFDPETGDFVDFKPEFTTVIDEAQFFRDEFAKIKASTTTTVQNKLDSEEYEFKNMPEYDGFVLFNTTLGERVTNEPQITQMLESLNTQIRDKASVIGGQIDYFNTGTEEEREVGIQKYLNLAKSISKEFIDKSYKAEEIDARFHQNSARRSASLYPDTNPTGGNASVVNKVLTPIESKDIDLSFVSKPVADILNLIGETQETESTIIPGVTSVANPLGFITGAKVITKDKELVNTRVGSPQMQTLENELFNPTSDLGSWLIHKKSSGDKDFDDFELIPFSDFILTDEDLTIKTPSRTKSEKSINLYGEKYPGESEYNYVKLQNYLSEIEGLVENYGQLNTSEVSINDKLGRQRLGYDKTKPSETLNREKGAIDLIDHIGDNVVNIYQVKDGKVTEIDKGDILAFRDIAEASTTKELKLLGEIDINPEALRAFGENGFEMVGAQTMEFTDGGEQTQIYVESLDFKRVFKKQFPNGEATLNLLSGITPIKQTPTLMLNPRYKPDTPNSPQYLKINLTQADDGDNPNTPSPFANTGDKTPYVAVLSDGSRHRVSLDYVLDANIFRYDESAFADLGLTIADLTGINDEKDLR